VGVIQFFSITIIPPMLHTHLHQNTNLISKTSNESWKPLNKEMLFQKLEALEGKVLSFF
jgi:hypothetical protein